MTISGQVLEEVATHLQEKFGFTTQTMLDKAVADIAKQTQKRESRGGFSLSKMIRGLRAMEHSAINASTAEADVAYVKALTTGSQPGSFLVPTVQSEQIVEFLTIGGVARGSGVTVWPMAGVQKLTVPMATAVPSWVWMAQNSVQTATDPNLGQMSFDLKERRALVAVPNQLLAVSVPAFDTLLAKFIGFGAAEHEDQSFFNTTTLSGGPTALYANIANLTAINVGGSANGGNIGYLDILNCLANAIAQKAHGPFAWYFSPRTFFTRILGLLDGQSRPLVIPTYSEGLYNAIRYTLLGWPVFVTPYLLENESLGSGTNQAHAIFTNPSYLHVAQDEGIQIAYSLDKWFDANQTAIRAIQHLDFGYAPPLGIVVLRGIN
jgi:HK97 family phage major capsid protein